MKYDEIKFLSKEIETYLDNYIFVNLQKIKYRNWLAIPCEAGIIFTESEIQQLIDYAINKKISHYCAFAIEKVELGNEYLFVLPTMEAFTKYNIDYGRDNYIFCPSTLDFFIICRSSESIFIIVGESQLIERIIGMSIQDAKEDFKELINSYNPHPNYKDYQEYLLKIYNYYFPYPGW